MVGNWAKENLGREAGLHVCVGAKGGLPCSGECDGPAGATETRLGPEAKGKDTEYF